MVVFRYQQAPPYLTWSVIRPNGSGTEPTPIGGLERPVMIHDMALTRHYVVLVLAPLFFHPRRQPPGPERQPAVMRPAWRLLLNGRARMAVSEITAVPPGGAG